MHLLTKFHHYMFNCLEPWKLSCYNNNNSNNMDSYGLQLNLSKCEAMSRTGAVHYAVIGGFQQKTTDSATLLGAPLSTGSAMSDCLQARRDDLTRAVKRLNLVSAHDALVLLKNSLSAPKLLHTLCSTCCVDHDLRIRGVFTHNALYKSTFYYYYSRPSTVNCDQESPASATCL